MRISFLCGSFEPGRDGVGDYVAQFVTALTQRGHVCQVLALADRYAATPSIGLDAAGLCEVARLPMKAWRDGDIGFALRAAEDFAADWSSLQMVCYAFDKRGLLHGAAGRLARFKGRARRHLMVHEPWIGFSRESGFRERVMGSLQRHFALRALRQWGPAVVHTSNPPYRKELGRAGLEAGVLPLPGNIPLAAPPAGGARSWLLGRLGQGREGSDAAVMLVGLFGSIHPSGLTEGWLASLAEACAAAGRPLVLVRLGRTAPAGLAAWQALARSHAEVAGFAELGELPAAEISLALQGLDVGIATTPWALAGKSGTIAAMLEHGLPVVVLDSRWRLRVGDTPEPLAHPRLLPWGPNVPGRLARGELGHAPPAADGAIYDRFVEGLAAAASP